MDGWMKCLLCGKDHERGTPHPLNDRDLVFWNSRLNVAYETLVIEEKEEKEELKKIIQTKKRGRPRHE